MRKETIIKIDKLCGEIEDLIFEEPFTEDREIFNTITSLNRSIRVFRADVQEIVE